MHCTKLYLFLSSPSCFRLMRTLLDESSTRHWWESKVIGHGSANACVWLQASDQNAFVTFVLEMWLSACVCFFVCGVGLAFQPSHVRTRNGW